MYTLENVAKALGLEFSGDGTRTVSAVAALATAKAGDLSFLTDKKYVPLSAST